MVNFLQPQVESGSSARSSIFAPTQAAKKGSQRPAGHVSSVWCVRICPSQLIGLKERKLLGTSWWYEISQMSVWSQSTLFSQLSSALVLPMWCHCHMSLTHARTYSPTRWPGRTMRFKPSPSLCHSDSNLLRHCDNEISVTVTSYKHHGVLCIR